MEAGRQLVGKIMLQYVYTQNLLNHPSIQRVLSQLTVPIDTLVSGMSELVAHP